MNIVNFFKKNTVLCIAMVAAFITMFIVQPDAQYLGYFDYKTLTCLFCVLAVVCAFKNIDFFLPLLPKLQHGIMDSKEWNSIILSINNPNLTMDWEKRCNLPIQRWIDKLASWGVSCEKCTSFKGNEYYVDKYEITSDSEMLEGKQYEVIDWYWVLTTINAEGVTEKKILLKGKAK